MAEILCVTNGLPGLLYTSLEMARRLVIAGHQVTYCSYPETEPTVRAHGLPFRALDRGSYETFLRDDARTSWPKRLLSRTDRRRRALESLDLAGFQDLLHTLRPDVLLIDGELHEQIVVASAVDLNLALLNTFVATWRRPRLPPAHCAVTPGIGWQGSLIGIQLLWLALRLRKLHRAASLRFRRVGCDRLSLLRQLSRIHGFDFRRETDASQWLIPFTYRHLPLLSLHARELEFPHNPPPHVSFVGPMVPKERQDDRVTSTVEASLGPIFQRRRASRGQRKLIYAGFGSFFSTDERLLERLVTAVAERPEWDLVISLAGRRPPTDLLELPANAHIFPWVPQLEVLRETDVAVVHGGINTADECVLAGVPMLIYCGHQTDMAGTTQRVLYHGLGLAGDSKRDDPVTIRSHLNRLLTDTALRESIDRMQTAFARYEEDGVMERVVQSLVPRDAHTE